jgi:hypothetical protein
VVTGQTAGAAAWRPSGQRVQWRFVKRRRAIHPLNALARLNETGLSDGNAEAGPADYQSADSSDTLLTLHSENATIQMHSRCSFSDLNANNCKMKQLKID